uniref:Protein kinase domain-containing protein n=1 Tax=viral metagenome TaxID=1070528 RepID=A0A6C0K6I3_9ZZZZ
MNAKKFNDYEDRLKIISMMRKIPRNKNVKRLRTSVAVAAIKRRRLLLRKRAIKNHNNGRGRGTITTTTISGSRRTSLILRASKISKMPLYNSGSRVFSKDIYVNHSDAAKSPHLLNNNVLINKNTLANRIKNYRLLKQKLSQLNRNDCLERKVFNGVAGYTIRDIINLERRIGTKSKYGTIYLTSIPKISGIYPIASKLMKNDIDNINEVYIMTKITTDIILKKISKHFLMIYGDCTCSKRIAQKIKLISINELADGDLKMLINMREVAGNSELMFNLLFQTFISIATFHNIAGYTHRDAHYGNFLYQTNSEKGYYHYIFNGKDYYLKATKCNIIIFDYGFARKILPYNKGSEIALINRQNKKITEDYQRIINAFFNKNSGGWGSFPRLPAEPTNSKMLDIAIKLDDIYSKEFIYNNGTTDYAKKLFGIIIEEIFLKYTPKGMFDIKRPPNVINRIPYMIN